MDLWVYLISVKRYRCAACTEVAYEGNRNDSRSVDRNFGLYVKCVDNRRKLRNPVSKATVHVRRLLGLPRKGYERPTYAMPDIRERERGKTDSSGKACKRWC